VSAGRTVLSRTSMGENECGSCACVRELYSVDERVFIFLGLFIDDSVMSLQKLNVKIF
jgi:hypothetical protein